MDRLKTKDSGSDLSQWVFNIHSVWKWVQDFIENNLKKFLSKFFISSGVFYYGSQTSLKCSSVTINGGKYEIVIEAGSGINNNGDMIILSSQLTNNDNDDPGEGTKYLYLKHVLVDDTDATYEINRLPSSYTKVNVHKMDSYTLILADAWPTGDILDQSIKIAQIDQAADTSITVTDAREKVTIFSVPAAAWTWINDNYDQINKDYTTASDFYIGHGSLGPGGAGVKVKTQPTTPEDPLNFRIYDINPLHSRKQESMARVTFKWGWENLTGAHYEADGSNTIRVTAVKAGSDALEVDADDLIGCRLYCPNFQSDNQCYLIEDNEATAGGVTVITLEDNYNNESMSENGNIIINGDKIEISVVPVIEEEEKNWRSNIITLTDHYVFNQTYTMILDMKDEKGQAKYTPKIRAWSSDEHSAWVTMVAGSYDPDHNDDGQSVVNYSIPFTCQLPNLDEVASPGTLMLQTTFAGFAINIGGWEVENDADKTAHYFEVIYTTLDNVNWGDYSNSIRRKVRSRIVDVPCSYVQKWAVGVRPLQNEQVVGTAKTGSIVSGAMGVTPSDQAILNSVEIDIRTYSGTMSIESGYSVSLDSYNTPAGTANTAVLQSVMGYLHSHRCILKDSAGVEFLIDQDSVDLGGGINILCDLINLSGGSASPSAGAYEINTTEKGRQIKVMNSLQIEMDAVQGYFDSDIIKGATVDNPAILRVCQNSASGKTHADLLSVYENDAAYEFNTDFKIKNAYGNLGLLFDAYDPSETSPNNTACIRGRFTLFMRPSFKSRTIGESRTQV